MNDVYDRWLESRAKGDVPAGFSDRVVEQAARIGSSRRVPLWIAAAAGAAFLVRATCTFLVFVAS